MLFALLNKLVRVLVYLLFARFSTVQQIGNYVIVPRFGDKSPLSRTIERQMPSDEHNFLPVYLSSCTRMILLVILDKAMRGLYTPK